LFDPVCQRILVHNACNPMGISCLSQQVEDLMDQIQETNLSKLNGEVFI
jgi:hypothetical protein